MKINHLAVRPEPFGSPFVLRLSKDERQLRTGSVEGRTVSYDTASEGEGKQSAPPSLSPEPNVVRCKGEVSPAPRGVQEKVLNLIWFRGEGPGQINKKKDQTIEPGPFLS
jgi:hypothetical protein